MILFDNEGAIKDKIYSNEEFYKLEGYIEEETAKITLAKFLYNNLGITSELLLGIKLFPFQEIILRSWFDHNFNFFVASRGGSKSYLSAIFCCLYPIFYPETRIVLTANAFRSTRRTILQAERFLNAKGASLMRQCFTSRTGRVEFKRHSDEFTIEINGGSIIALPLNEKIRGTRGDILFCDEFLMINEELYKSVLMPFLTAKNNIQEELKRKEYKESLKIEELSEEEQGVLDGNKKIIALTSASYDFDFACKMFNQWVGKIEKEEPTARKYFLTRMSYKALPEELVEKDIIEEAANGGEESAVFQREFMALFTSTSDGFFNIKKLHDNTIPNGDLPCVQLKGTKDSKYIVSVDPSFSSSKSSDFFAIGVYLLNSDDRSLTLVHSYGKAGDDLKNIIKYFYYILSHFNVVFVVADLGGANFNFIEASNESGLFLEHGMKLSFIDGKLDSDGYLEELRIAKNSYNLFNKRICYRQIFASDWLRKSNEYLQSQIDRNKVKFASQLRPNETMIQKVLQDDYSLILDGKGDRDQQLLELIEEQDYFIEETKRQLALIECKATPLGTMQFDLPQHMKRSKKSDRVRRDNYTCLLMATWGAKIYWDMLFTEEKKNTDLFVPRLV